MEMSFNKDGAQLTLYMRVEYLHLIRCGNPRARHFSGAHQRPSNALGCCVIELYCFLFYNILHYFFRGFDYWADGGSAFFYFFLAESSFKPFTGSPQDFEADQKLVHLFSQAFGNRSNQLQCGFVAVLWSAPSLNNPASNHQPRLLKVFQVSLNRLTAQPTCRNQLTNGYGTNFSYLQNQRSKL